MPSAWQPRPAHCSGKPPPQAAKGKRKAGVGSQAPRSGCRISHSDYHRHGAYILDNTDAAGFAAGTAPFGHPGCWGSAARCASWKQIFRRLPCFAKLICLRPACGCNATPGARRHHRDAVARWSQGPSPRRCDGPRHSRSQRICCRKKWWPGRKRRGSCACGLIDARSFKRYKLFIPV